jgi:hypothetical protein
MSKLDEYKWSEMFENSNKIMRQMIALNLQADRIFDGRSKGVTSERICRNRLLLNVHETEYESIVKEVIRESRDRPWILAEYVKKQLQTIAKIIPNGEVDISELTKLTAEVKKKLRDNEELQMVSDLGLRYFESGIKILSWFERSLPEQLKQDGKNTRSNGLVQKLVISRFKQIQIYSSLLGYAGIRFTSYGYSSVKRTPRRWCRICFRRTATNTRKYCEYHNSSNGNVSALRFGKKIHRTLLEHPQNISTWRNHRKCILESEEEERELNGLADSPWINWKQLLINFINKRQSLAERISVKHLQSVSSWVEVVKYLRVLFDNKEEKSYHVKAVFSWLAMAADWFEIEDMHYSSDGKILKSSRSPNSKIPTANLISTLCEREPGIKKAEIARRLAISESAVGQCIRKHKELHKHFPA